jgi:predicted amidohydrolase
MKIEIPQRAHVLGDIDHNLKAMLDSISSSDSDLLVFPELYLTGYLCRDRLTDLAITIEDERIQQLRDASKNAGRGVIFGMPEASSQVRGQIFNSAVYINPSGELDVYRKVHLVNFGPFEEKQYFTPGKEIHLMNIKEFRFGAIICYDIFFPELAKLYALQGADMIVCLSASPTTTKQFFQKVMIARAIESTVFFIYANLIGTEKNLVFWGGSTIVGPRGEVKAQSKELEADKIVLELDAGDLRIARENRPTLRDTRYDLFEALKTMGDIDMK